MALSYLKIYCLSLFTLLTITRSRGNGEWKANLGTINVCEGYTASLPWISPRDFGRPYSLKITKLPPFTRDYVKGEGGRSPLVLDSRATFSYEEGLVIHNVSEPEHGEYSYTAVHYKAVLEGQAFIKVYSKYECPEPSMFEDPIIHVRSLSAYGAAGLRNLGNNSISCVEGSTLHMYIHVPPSVPPVTCTVTSHGTTPVIVLGDPVGVRNCGIYLTFNETGSSTITFSQTFIAHRGISKTITVFAEEPSSALPGIQIITHDTSPQGIRPAIGITVSIATAIFILLIMLAIYAYVYRRRQKNKQQKKMKPPPSRQSLLRLPLSRLSFKQEKESEARREISRIFSSQVSRSYRRMTSGSPAPTKPKILQILRGIWQEGDPKEVERVAPDVLTEEGELDLSGFTRVATGENLRAVMFFIKNCDSVRLVNFARSWIGDVALKDLCAAIIANGNIKEITLWGNRITSTGVFYLYQAAAANKNLESLDISHNLIGDAAKIKLKDMMEMRTAMELWISGNGLSPALAEIGMQSYGCRLDLGVQGYLEKIDCEELNSSTDLGDPLEEVIDPFSVCPWERRVSAANTLTSFYQIYHASKPGKVVQLEHNILSGCCTVLDLGCLSSGVNMILMKAINLLIQHSRVLRKLSLMKNEITDAHVACLTSVYKSQTLEQIEMWENNITNVGMEYLCSQIMSCGRLICLKLNYNQIKDGDAPTIESVLEGNFFLELWLSGNEITSERQKELSDRYKDRIDVQIPEMPSHWNLTV